jgi:integrase
MHLSSNNEVGLMPKGRHRVEGETGLYLYVSPDEQIRRWIFRFTSPATKRVTETGLDMVEAVSLVQARAKAHELRKQIAAGVCPIAAKRAERTSQVTFQQAANEWVAVHKPSWKGGDAGSQMNNARVLLHNHGALLATKRVAEITPDQVQAALKQLWERSPLQGRRALNMWERVFDFAKAKSWIQGQNPAQWKGLMQYRFPRIRKWDKGHYSAMDYAQVPEFMKVLRQRQERSTGAAALEFLILTCARRGEVLGMQWSEIDWDKKLWILPEERTKQGRAHTVPLSERAMAILEQQKQYRNGSEFVFTGYRQTQMDNKSLAAQLRSMKIDATVHGFRSTFRDYMGNETNFAREPVEHCLAHRLGNSVEQAYRRQDALNKRRVIMDHWAEYCAGGAQ